MSGRYRASRLLILGAVTIGLVASFILFLIIQESVATSDFPAETQREISALVARALIPATIIIIAVCLALGAYFAHVIAAPLRRLRSELADLARGDRTTPITAAIIEEQALIAEGIAGLVQDFRNQRAAIEQERIELAGMLESGAEGLLQVNKQGRVVHCNRAASQLLGLPADPRGQSINSLIRIADVREMIGAAINGETPEARDLTFEDRQIVIDCRPLPSDNGAVIAIVDLTEIRRLETVRRDFVANVSHELKTPLTAIRGYVETLQQDDLSDEMRAQFLDVVQKNTARIQHIVDDLLDLSRLQSGGWRPEPQPVDAAAVARDAWASCLADARKDVNFEVISVGDTYVTADPGGLRQVYSNLFDNALRYTPPGGKVVVRITSATTGRRISDTNPALQIEVQDNGSGIPRDALPRIFERFYRVDPARSRAEGGTGLGLSIVKHLLERMGGDVTAESEIGKGTTVRFRLPAA